MRGEQRHTETRKARAMALRELRRRRRLLLHDIRSVARGDIDQALVERYRENQDGNTRG